MLGVVEEYSISGKLGTVGWTGLASSFGSRVESIRHEKSLPGGDVSLEFDLVGECAVPRGTRIHARVGGLGVWSGEVSSVQFDPVSRRTRVSCRGVSRIMQEDISYDKTYVVADMSKFIDHRLMSGQSYATFQQFGGEVGIDERGINLRVPNGTIIPANCNLAASRDMGPNNTAKVLVVTWVTSANDSTNSQLYYGNDANGIGGFDESAVITNLNTAAGGPTTYTFTTARRFVMFDWFRTTGVTSAADLYCTITQCIISTSSSYISGNASILKVSDVASDIVANAGIPYISSSTALISAGSTSIAELYTDGYENVFSLLERANKTDRMQWFLTSDAAPRMTLRTAPTTPRFMLLPGEYELSDPKGEAIEDVYNSVNVEYTALDGSRNSTTVTLSPDTTVLAAQGRTRKHTLRVERACTSTEATALGTSFLRESKKMPLRGGLRTTKGYIRSYPDGNVLPLAVVGVGDMIELPAERAPETGSWARRGIIFGASYDHDARQLTLTLDQDASIFDKQMAALSAA